MYYHVTNEFQSESKCQRTRLPLRQGTPCLEHAPYVKFK